jgi:hypothetical protein
MYSRHIAVPDLRHTLPNLKNLILTLATVPRFVSELTSSPPAQEFLSNRALPPASPALISLSMLQAGGSSMRSTASESMTSSQFSSRASSPLREMATAETSTMADARLSDEALLPDGEGDSETGDEATQGRPSSPALSNKSSSTITIRTNGVRTRRDELSSPEKEAGTGDSSAGSVDGDVSADSTQASVTKLGRATSTPPRRSRLASVFAGSGANARNRG